MNSKVKDDHIARLLERPARLLSERDRMQYFEHGYLGRSGLVSAEWLARLNAVTDDFVEQSKSAEANDRRFDCEPDHSASAPRLRRLNNPVELHSTYWEFASEGPFADIAEDLLGADVKFHHSKLNFKWSGGGEEVKWHQDIQFWPHTNYDVLTIGVYLEDVTDDNAPMGILPGSHEGPLYDLYDHAGNGPATFATRTLSHSTLRQRVTSPARRVPSRCTTAAQCTALHQTCLTACGPCSCVPIPQQTHSRSPVLPAVPASRKLRSAASPHAGRGLTRAPA